MVTLSDLICKYCTESNYDLMNYFLLRLHDRCAIWPSSEIVSISGVSATSADGMLVASRMFLDILSYILSIVPCSYIVPSVYHLSTIMYSSRILASYMYRYISKLARYYNTPSAVCSP